MGWFIAHLLNIVIIGATVSTSGLGLDTWRYWIILCGMTFSYICGRERESE